MLQRVINPQQGKIRFGYDPLGRRVYKETNYKRTNWLWNGNVPLHEWESLSTESILLLVTWIFEEGTFVPCAKITEDQSYSIVTDYLGTPTQMFDEDGRNVWDAELDIYGKVRTFKGSSLNDCPFRYQGQYEDSETGLYYNRFRYYDPNIGNYISQDPIGLAGNNPTLYGYVHNPNSWIDPFGLIIVYRAVNLTQETAVKAGTNIQPKDINASYSIQQHVENGRLNTQYISTTKEINRAEFYAKSNNATIIAIDTDKIDPKKVIDISRGIDPQTGKPLKGKAFGYSTKDAEVLIDGEIPKDTYTTVKKHH